MKEKKISGEKTRVPGADESKNAFDVIKTQLENFKSLKKISRVPKHSDILIIGGGIIGSFVAYWIRNLSPSLTVTVVEKDSMYQKSSTFWSVGGFRQQFSIPENIKMSLFGAEFLRTAHEELKCGEDDRVDLPINLDGYLFLASEQSANLLYENHKIQLAQKAKCRLLNPQELKEKFKWLNVDDLKLGSFGYQNEGWIDPKKYLLAVRKKAQYLGVDYVNGEIIGFEEQKENSFLTNGYKKVDTALVDTFDDKVVPIKYQTVVNAAGPWASQVARLAGIGTGSLEISEISPLCVSLPVEPRKRYIFMFYAENGPILNTPLTIDYTGVFFRRLSLSNYYLCGLNQSENNEPSNLDLKHIDYSYFEERIKPVLIKRVPSFRDLKVVDAWSGYYDYNTLDQNLIIGRHPVHNNFIFANGSSGHGLQHAAAIGRAVYELVCHQTYKTIDLKRFGFERVLRDQPLKEIDVV